MYKPTHFEAYELVDKDTYDLIGNNSIKLFNEGLLRDLDNLREFFNRPILINNWYNGGVFQNRGFRTRKSKVGNPTSQHRLGNAIDFDVLGVDVGKVIKHITDNPHLYPSINRFEKNVSWNHIDCHPNYKEKRIYGFMP